MRFSRLLRRRQDLRLQAEPVGEAHQTIQIELCRVTGHGLQLGLGQRPVELRAQFGEALDEGSGICRLAGWRAAGTAGRSSEKPMQELDLGCE